MTKRNHKTTKNTKTTGLTLKTLADVKGGGFWAVSYTPGGGGGNERDPWFSA